MKKYVEMLITWVELSDDGEVQKIMVGEKKDDGAIVLDRAFYGDIAKTLYKNLFPRGINND